MGKRGRAKELDGRPLHGYGVLLESDVGRYTNIDTAFGGLVFGPLVAFVGIAIASATEPDIHKVWYVGVGMFVLGVVAFLGGVFLTVRGYRRRRSQRSAEKAAMAALDGQPVPRLELRDRRRY